jgi:hypothetical protein
MAPPQRSVLQVNKKIVALAVSWLSMTVMLLMLIDIVGPSVFNVTRPRFRGPQR